jgi:endonuclease YncB( thermonuclease family)
MKNINYLLMAILLAVSFPVAANKTPASVEYSWKVTKVKDGDTVEFEANFLPKPLKPVLSVRVFGVDTPEKAPRAKCEAEAQLGAKASEYTKKAVAEAKDIKVSLMSWDKFGGRVLGDVILDGKSLRQGLIEAGLAREYYGEAKESWCK